MPPERNVIYKGYQVSTHRNLGFFTGEQDDVLTFCSIKYNIEPDDIALERMKVRNVTKTEVLFFQEVLGQIRNYSSNLIEEENESAGDIIKEDLEVALRVLSPLDG